MYYRSPHHHPPSGHSSASGPTPQPSALPALLTGLSDRKPTSPSRQIAIPAPGPLPSFDDVFGLAVTSALFDQTVLVICMTDEVMTHWRHRLQERTQPLDGLELLDGQSAWSADWRAFFCSRRHDVTVLHGVRHALQNQSLPLSYVRRLVDAVPAGLIVLA